MSRCSLPLWRPPQLRPQVWVMQKLAWPTPRPVAVEDGCTCLVSERQGWEAGPRPPIEARNLARPAHHTRDRGGAASPFERPRLWSDASAGSSDTGGRRSSPSVESTGAGNKRGSRKYSAEAKLFASADPPSLLETYFDQTLGGGGGGAGVGGESKEHEVQQASVRSRTNARMSDAEDAFLEGAY